MSLLQARKKRTLAKLGWVCAKIEEILAGANLTLSDVKLPESQTPGETELERFQRFKALLSETLAEINRGEARTCLGCQQPIADALLDEMPWSFRCPACAAD